jgi:hypothetical protein
MYNKEFGKEHEEREKHMDEKLKEVKNYHKLFENHQNKKFKEAMDSIRCSNETLDRLNKSVDNYCNTIKRFSIIMISLIILITIIGCGFNIYLMFQI